SLYNKLTSTDASSTPQNPGDFNDNVDSTIKSINEPTKKKVKVPANSTENQTNKLPGS
ncbi:unnamed protein product, partial [Candidula unifasciata]